MTARSQAIVRTVGRRQAVVRAALVLLAAARLGLAADHDILALNQPYDDYWFVSSAYRWIWGGPYDQFSFAQLPVYPIYLKLQALVGMPARLGIDLAWLGASAYLALVMNRLCRRSWPGLLAFFFLCFHPYPLVLFDRALSENLTVVATTIALAALIDVWNVRQDPPQPGRVSRRTIVAGSVGALAFAIAFHSRKEGIVLLVPMLVLGLLSLLHRQLWWRVDRGRLGRWLLVLPLVATIVLGASLATSNYLRWGVFARYELAAPHYVRAIGLLNAIAPDGPQQKWVAVTESTRTRAYAASPTLRQLEPLLEGTMKQYVLEQQALYGGAKGDIGNGWFYWMLRQAAALAGWHRSAVHAELQYAKVGDEIEDAFEKGTLKRRPVLVAFVDPDWRKWLPDLPAALVGEARQLVAPDAKDLVLPTEDATGYQEEAYVRITGRRHRFKRIEIEGWLIVEPGSTVALGTAASLEPPVVLAGPARVDVPRALPFHVTSNGETEASLLRIRTTGGIEATVPLKALRKGKMQPVDAIPEGVIGIDRVAIDQAPIWPPSLVDALCTTAGVAGWIFLVAGIVAIGWVGNAESPVENAARLILLVSLTAIAARIGLLALLDSSSWQGQQSRYMLPSLPLFAVFGTIGLWKIAERLSGSPRRLRLASTG